MSGMNVGLWPEGAVFARPAPPVIAAVVVEDQDVAGGHRVSLPCGGNPQAARYPRPARAQPGVADLARSGGSRASLYLNSQTWRAALCDRQRMLDRGRVVYRRSSLGERSRQRRWLLFAETFPELATMRIVDLGGRCLPWSTASMARIALTPRLLRSGAQPVK